MNGDLIRPEDPNTRRQESLWSGEFGDAYTRRNAAAGAGRSAYWMRFLGAHSIRSILEVGCNLGANLSYLASHVARAVGVDINASALQELRLRVPGAFGVRSSATSLPFRDAEFELAFTAGVLIHLPDSSLHDAMAEIHRCARRYVLCLEYFAEQTVDVLYRGQRGALFKRNYGGLYADQFPKLALLERGFLGKNDGWDDVTYWVFQK